MGLLKALFGRKKEENKTSGAQSKTENQPASSKPANKPLPVKVVSQPSPSVVVKQIAPNITVTMSKKPSAKVQDMVLIAVSEKYKVCEKKYPDCFSWEYGIAFPAERFKALEKKGYIKPASAAESLSGLKLAELKELAARNGLAVSGKKDALCKRIAEGVSSSALEVAVKERYWKITDAGRELLDQNPYIEFYLEDHPYSLKDVNLNLYAMEKLLSDAPKELIRKKIWAELSRQSLELGKSNTSESCYDQCSILRFRALFREEEEKYEEALGIYMDYISLWHNGYAMYSVRNSYDMFRTYEFASHALLRDGSMRPFILKEILRISSECNYDSEQLKSFMNNAFSNDRNCCYFTPKELTDFVMFSFSNDEEGKSRICEQVVNRLKKR